MKFLQISLVFFGLSFISNAQDLETEDENIPGSDEVQRAIDEFNRLKREDKSKDNEVTVVLDPPETSAPLDTAPEEEETVETENAEKNPPVLVSGKPPEPLDETSDETTDKTDNTAEAISLPLEKEQTGPNVRVQSIRTGSGEIDPDKINLRASFPVKPLSDAPSGWQLVPSENAPSFSKDVEIHPGTVIALSITPYVLSPDADGINTFSVSEPGYEPGNSYSQEKTVGAILGQSIEQLDQDSIKMGNIISDLHQLLASLPKPETPEELTEKP